MTTSKPVVLSPKLCTDSAMDRGVGRPSVGNGMLPLGELIAT
jgi:hypothetical protein